MSAPLRSARLRRASIVMCAVLLAACTTTRSDKWGEHTTWTPGFAAIKNAAVRAATAPGTWVPLATAGVLTVTGADDNLSEEIADHQPLFGGDAEEASSDLRNLTYAAYVVTALAAPGDGTVGGWLHAKVRGLEAGVVALSAEGLTSEALKSMTNRERPDGENERSFPSGHAGQAGAAATLAVANLDYLGLPNWARGTAAVGLYGAALGSGWGRVESERHFLTDSLFGFALGHYIARFVQEAFFEGGRSVSVRSVPIDDGIAFQIVVPTGD